MGSSPDRRFAHFPLQVEHLEDRITPAYDPTLPLSAQVASGAIEPDRVTVVMNDIAGSGNILSSAPFATNVKSLGWGMYSVRLAAGTDLGTAISYLGSLPGVGLAEPDQIVHAAVVPNDPQYSSQYGPAITGAEQAWNITTGNPNFVVGVIDTGIDYTHPDLAANIWTNPGEIPGNGIDDDGNGFVDDVHGWNFAYDDNDPYDDNEHGTHVSGTIGAVGNNGIGVTGMNWNVKLMAIKFLDDTGSGATSDAIASIHYSVIMGAKVTNNSWGGFGADPALGRAIGMSENAGQIFVAAAGNFSLDNDIYFFHAANYSTLYNNVVTVAATDSNDQLADFSDYGANSVTLAAPGVAILSTTPNNTYSYLDGTSMATPHVTGAIALYWGANPTLTYLQVINKLKASVDHLPNLVGKVETGGRLNVAKMFNLTPQPPVVVGAPPDTQVVRELAPGGTTQRALTPYDGYLGGVAAAAGDVNGDGVADIVTAASLNGHIKVFDGRTGAEIQSFYSFENYLGSVSVAVGDMNGDGFADIVVAAALNGHVKVFDGVTDQLIFSEFLYQGYAGAVDVSVSNVNGSNQLFTAANGAAGIHIKQFTEGAMASVASYIVLGPNSWSDFSFSAADLNLDGIPELLVSQGPRVVVLDYNTKAIQSDLLAYDPMTSGTVRVEAGQYLGNPANQLVAINQTQGQSHVEVYNDPDFVLIDSFIAGSR